MTFSEILFEVEQGIATLTLNRPETRNIITSAEMIAEIRTVCKTVNVGIIPGDGGAYFLPKVVGMARACEMTFTGDVLTGKDALDMGLVNYLTQHEDLLPRAMELARKIAGKPPEALRMAKRLLYMGQSMTLSHLLEQSAAFQALCHHTKDHEEALSAMFEKRKPNFKGE